MNSSAKIYNSLFSDKDNEQLQNKSQWTYDWIKTLRNPKLVTTCFIFKIVSTLLCLSFPLQIHDIPEEKKSLTLKSTKCERKTYK